MDNEGGRGLNQRTVQQAHEPRMMASYIFGVIVAKQRDVDAAVRDDLVMDDSQLRILSH